MSINKFVINIVSPSHGHTDYQLISNLKEFKEMTKTLNEKIEKFESLSVGDSKFETNGNVLFNHYVTLAPGKTDRNSITFVLDSELTSYERITFWQSHIREFLTLSVLISVLILALIGLITVISFFLD